MANALNTLRAVQWAMLGSILLYVFAGEFLRPARHALDPSVSYAFATAGVAIVGIIFVVRRTLVFRAEETLATQPEDALSLKQWKTGYLATYAMCESLALFGLAGRFMGSTLQQAVSYYIAGFVLMVFFRPRWPEAPAAI
jgi:hypothetical protein